MTSNHSVRKARLAAERMYRESERDGRPDDAPATTAHRRYFADGLTRYGHSGQCAGCGVWRADGRPPTVHRAGCVYGPDGSQLAPVFDPSALHPKTPAAVKPTLTPSTRPDRPRR